MPGPRTATIAGHGARRGRLVIDVPHVETILVDCID
jgi:hypothetical protein